jgi:hypothetical protein
MNGEVDATENGMRTLWSGINLRDILNNEQRIACFGF